MRLVVNRRSTATLAALVMALVPAAAAHAAPAKNVRTYDKNMLRYVNAARTNHGLKPLKESAGLYAVAHSRAAFLAKHNAVGHPPNLGPQVQAKCPKMRTVGENSGAQGKTSAHKMFELYKASPIHWANIISPDFGYVGIATIKVPNGDGTAAEYDVMDFADHCA
ncbi:MAG TPA: CAP domain-containing protein [Mycobacteriales bacterium]|jgi:uncharacterized protein YkwD|nr:CAP domain-containing protein [Mycobacteriales bacterium]